MKILVTGGTGTLGRAVVPRLTGDGHDVRAISRRSRAGGDVEWAVADLATGQGLAGAVDGVNAIVHLASAPYSFGYTRKVDVQGTARLAAAARDAGVAHLLYVSIVGIDKIPWGYYRTKLAAEKVVRGSGLGWTVLRATQFHQLLDTALGAMARLRFLVIDPGIKAQPVDPRDVADRIAALVHAGPADSIVEYGGPEVLGMDALRSWQRARGLRLPVFRVRIPGRLGRGFRAGFLTTTARPTGQITWQEYLREK